jgi:hypothetical protein
LLDINLDMNNEFIKGTVSSVIASTVVYPVEVLKTNYQIHTYVLNSIKNSPSTYLIARNIYKKEGYSGFYRGISTQLTTYPVFWGVYFQVASYKPFQTNSQYVNNSGNILIASTIASAAANPAFVLRTHMQMNQTSDMSTNPIKIKKQYIPLIKHLMRTEGFRWMTKGMITTMLNNSKLCLQFPLYDLFKKEINNPLAAGFMAKAISSSIYYPFDLIRSNQRLASKHISLHTAFKTIYRSKGLTGFYAGIWLYNGTSLPNFAIMMALKEYFDCTISLNKK